MRRGVTERENRRREGLRKVTRNQRKRRGERKEREGRENRTKGT